jgi:WhiB family transcriptional regulator, redox-sensing transcriptional regulator
MFAEDPALSWQDAAECQYTDPEAFFPEKGGSVRQAKRVCRSCDVRAECLEYALENCIAEGIWGGLTERERRRVRSGIPAPARGPRLCQSRLHVMTEGNTRPGGGCAACKRAADDRENARRRAARAAGTTRKELAA